MRYERPDSTLRHDLPVVQQLARRAEVMAGAGARGGARLRPAKFLTCSRPRHGAEMNLLAAQLVVDGLHGGLQSRRLVAGILARPALIDAAASSTLLPAFCAASVCASRSAV